MTVALTSQQLDFRTAMAQLSAAVNVVTSDGAAGRVGITVSAVCSVTDSPPTVLVCLNQSSYTHDVIRRNQRVCVNVLGADHADLALDFAGATKLPMDERFARADWEDVDGVPVLSGATASLVGHVVNEIVHGTHTVMFVRIDAIVRTEGRGGLVYHQRRFHPISV